jgi:hypothetical protein
MKYLLPIICISLICSCSVSKKIEKSLYGKWNITSVTNESVGDMGTDLKKNVGHLLEGSYLIFNKDKSFEYHILNKSENGTWSISKEGDHIDIKDKSYYFQIVDLSLNKLTVNQIKNITKMLLTLEKIND